MSQKQTILVVDDEPPVLKVIKVRLTSEKYLVLTSSRVEQALKILNEQKVDLVITDVRMPGIGGMDLLKEIRSRLPDLPVILITAYGTIPDTVRAIKAGADDYLSKPFDGNDLIQKVNELLKTVPHPTTCKKTFSMDDFVSDFPSPSMKSLFELIERVIPSDANVLIMGESGVGKELLARLIHNHGPRRDHPLVVVDCGTTPNGLLESELFGHVRGSFTHAIRDKKGLIEAAEGGTLFLDEIGNISADMQARLLRFLEERKIRKIGDLKEIPVDCRIISATNLDLPRVVEAGTFREDLFYRLRVVTLQIPPLRERKEDIPILARRFLEQFCRVKEVPLMDLHEDTIALLCEHSWPGNVRELKNALEGAVTLSENNVLTPTDIQRTGIFETSIPPGRDSLSLEENERNLILRALDEAGWVKKDAANLLGISRRVIHYKIKKFGIDSQSRNPK